MNQHLIRKILAHPMVRRIHHHRVMFNNKYEIPFIFGLSNDGRTIYFDRRFPRYFKYRGRTIDNYELLKTSELIRVSLGKLGINSADANEVCARIESRIVKKELNWNSERYAKDFLAKHAYDGGNEFHKKLPHDIDLSDLGISSQQKSEMAVLQRYRMSEANKMLTTPHETYKIKRKQKNVGNLHQTKLSRM